MEPLKDITNRSNKTDLPLSKSKKSESPIQFPQQPPSASTPIQLKGSSILASTKEVLKDFQLDPSLSSLNPEKRNQIEKECLAAYEHSVRTLENVVSEAASRHPDAKKFAHEMCRRIALIANAFQEIIATDQGLSLLWKELVIRLGTAREFATYADGKSSGSVGFNPLAIEKVMKEGNLREQMLLIYASLWTTLPKIFDDPSLVKKINQKLEGDFQINAKMIEETKRASLESDPVKIFFKMPEPLTTFRNAGGRPPFIGPSEPRPYVKNIPDLTIREARATLQRYVSEKEFDAMKRGEKAGKELGEQTVSWIRGKDLYRVDPQSDFYKRAVALGSLPVITGPSGTSDGFLLGMKYLGMQGMEQQAILALIGWMVKEGDHSLHEIREAGSWHSIPYSGKPEELMNIYTPQFRNKLERKLAAQGVKPPEFYLSREYQLQVASKFKPT